MPNDRASPQAVLTAPSIVTGWSAQKVADFGSVPLQFNHELQRHPLFSDEALARLIESAKREDYLVNTMDVTTHDLSSRQEGEIRDLSGQAVMQAVENGHIWILLLRPQRSNPLYLDLLHRIYAEFSSRVQLLQLPLSDPRHLLQPATELPRK